MSAIARPSAAPSDITVDFSFRSESQNDAPPDDDDDGDDPSVILDLDELARLRQLEPDYVDPDRQYEANNAALGGVFATRAMMGDALPAAVRAQLIIRELLLYGGLLASTIVIAFFTSTTNVYLLNSALRTLFIQLPLAQEREFFALEDVFSAQQFWRYLNGPFLDATYWQSRWYNPRWEESFNASSESGGGNVSARWRRGVGLVQFGRGERVGMLLYENMLLGAPTMRQLRVENDTCALLNEYRQAYRKPCVADWSDDLTSTATDGGVYNFSGSTNKGFLGAIGLVGKLSTYPDAGYTVKLSAERRKESEVTLGELEAGEWIDHRTRAVFVAATLYNPHLNVFCIVKCVVKGDALY